MLLKIPFILFNVLYTLINIELPILINNFHCLCKRMFVQTQKCAKAAVFEYHLCLLIFTYINVIEIPFAFLKIPNNPNEILISVNEGQKV